MGRVGPLWALDDGLHGIINDFLGMVEFWDGEDAWFLAHLIMKPKLKAVARDFFLLPKLYGIELVIDLLELELVTAIDLTKCRLTENEAAQILGAVHCLDSIELSMNRYGISGVFLTTLMEVLERNDCELKEIVINHNPSWFSDLTLLDNFRIGEALAVNRCLKSLSLAGCGFSDEVGLELLEGLENNETLTKLDLSDNQLGDRFGTAIGHILESNQTLRDINLHNNELRRASAISIGKSICHNKTLEHLNLGSNCICSEGAKDILFGLQLNQTLVTLNLAMNRINTGAFPAFQGVLRSNKHIRHINIDENFLADVTLHQANPDARLSICNQYFEDQLLFETMC